MELSFKFQEKTYPIVITRKKRKRIAVKIDPSGWIRVSCPEHCSHRTAVKFLEKNRAWLEKALIIGMGNIGKKFSANQVFVPDVLMAAKAMTAAMAHLKP